MSYTVEFDVNLTPAVPWLRRQVVHDSRSWDFPAAPDATGYPTRPSEHPCRAAVWNQGKVGSCTMMAAAGLLMCPPFHTPARSFSKATIEQLYSEETRLDDYHIPGWWPPQDTGSSGLYSMKILHRRGWISSYQHAFGLRQTLATLLDRPVSLGMNWYDSMNKPDADGLITISPDAPVLGGHQILAVGQDPSTRLVKLRQSWGPEWGQGGYCYLGWDTLDRLLSERGDAITGVPLRATA